MAGRDNDKLAMHRYARIKGFFIWESFFTIFYNSKGSDSITNAN